jgi:hypothetical protein
VITECIAAYSQDLKFVQISAVVQDDTGATLHQHLKTASVKLMYNDTAFLTKQLEPIDFNEGEQAFYCFFLNPAVERDISVMFEVETYEGLKSKVKTPVRPGNSLPYQGIETNPSLPTRPSLNFSDSTNQINGVKTPL